MHFGLNKSLVDSMKKEITFMYPGPINRDVEINSDAADGKQSIIMEKVKNVGQYASQSSIYRQVIRKTTMIGRIV